MLRRRYCRALLLTSFSLLGIILSVRHWNRVLRNQTRQHEVKSLYHQNTNNHPSSVSEIPPLDDTNNHPPSVSEIPPLDDTNNHPPSVSEIPPLDDTNNHPPSVSEIPSLDDTKNHPPSVSEIPSLDDTNNHPPSVSEIPPLDDTSNHPPSISEAAPNDASRYFRVCHKDESVLRGNVQFDKFKEKLEEYAVFHREQIQLLERGGESAGVHTLTWYCPDNTLCSGLGDQLYRIQLTFLLAVASRRAFFIHWDQVSMETMKYLQPQAIQWDHKFDNGGTKNIRMVSKLSQQQNKQWQKSCEHLKELYDTDHTHLVVFNEFLYVPVYRGLREICECDARTRQLLEEMGVLSKDTLQFSFSLNYLQSVLLQYLFKFREEVVARVDEIQESVGLDRPYVGVHMRTGFLGNEYEETKVGRKFLKNKIIRSEDQWEKTLDCSIELATSMLGSSSLLYLATDSYKVKDLALVKYPGKVVTLDMDVQHIAMLNNTSSSAPLRQRRKLAGPLGMWVDFLILARSHALVRPFSGFSITAASYCYIPDSRTYTVPKCQPYH